MSNKDLHRQALIAKSAFAKWDVDSSDLLYSLGKFLEANSSVDLARKMNISPQYLGDIKAGRRKINSKFVTLLVEATQ